MDNKKLCLGIIIILAIIVAAFTLFGGGTPTINGANDFKAVSPFEQVTSSSNEDASVYSIPGDSDSYNIVIDVTKVKDEKAIKKWFSSDDDFLVKSEGNNIYVAHSIDGDYASASNAEIMLLELVEVNGQKYIISVSGSYDSVNEGSVVLKNMLHDYLDNFNKENGVTPIAVTS